MGSLVRYSKNSYRLLSYAIITNTFTYATTLIILVGIGILILRLNSSPLYAETPVQECDYESVEEQIQCLEQQLAKYAKERRTLEAKLNKLNRQAQNIQSKIALIRTEMRLLQLDIAENQLNIGLINADIKALEKHITKINSKLAAQHQEADHIIKQLDEYLLLKYSLNTLSWERILLEGDIYSVFEIMSYLEYYVSEYESKLNYLKLINKHIQQQEDLLSQKQAQLKAKQQELEEKLKALTLKKHELEAKRREQQQLLNTINESYRRTQQRLKELNAIVNEVDSQLTNILAQLYASGALPQSNEYVQKGTIIGFQGHTGCSFGSHLHFEIFKIERNRWVSIPVTYNNLLNIKNGVLTSNIARAPLDGARITQGYHGKGHALDMISTTAGDHSGQKYCKKQEEIKCPNSVYTRSWYQNLFNNELGVGCFNQNGEGAPVYAILPGKVYRGVDRYGSKYVYIIHEEYNLVSIYYHLK